jgi:hypothetical protein
MIGQQAQPQAPPLDVRLHRFEVSYHWALAVAVIAIFALGAVLLWTAYGTATQPDGEQVVTQLTTAWSTNDPTLFDKTYAEDAVLVGSDGSKYEGIEAIKEVSQGGAFSGFKPEVIGPIVQSGNTISATMRLAFGDGTVYYVTSILELNSAGQIVHHQDYGQHD